MSSTIQIKRSTTVRAVPDSLEPGELAMCLPAHIMYFGNEAGVAQPLIQLIDVSDNRNNIVDPRRGMFHYDEATKNLYVCTRGGDAPGWGTVGFPVQGGSLSAPVIIEGDPDGTVYLRTFNSQGEDNLGPRVYVNGLHSESFVVAETDIQAKQDLNVGRRTTTAELVATESQLNTAVRSNGASYLYNSNGNYTSGSITYVTISQLPPSNEVGVDGDIIFGW